MRTTRQATPIVSTRFFSAFKPIQFLENLKQMRFSGQLVFTARTGQQWFIYLSLGKIICATGGVHVVRRWRRHLATHCPQMLTRSLARQWDLSGLDITAFTACWEYQLLCLWVAQQQISREQAAKIIRLIITEILFDVVQAMPVTHQIKEDHSLSGQLVPIDVQQALTEIEIRWQVWRDAQVVHYCPNLAPVIKQPEQLRQRTSAQIYQTLTRLLNGQYTLYDIAVLMKRDVVQVVSSFLPYLHLELVELISIPDLATPVRPTVPTPPIISKAAEPAQFLVACVDDSPLVCKTMESLLTAAGYEFLGVSDGLRAIAMLLARKPDVIFLDLVMPNTNGYEICAHLRKLSYFRTTPILILTGNDGIVDRVRARLVGASDFLSKPLDAGNVLSAIRKHLEQGATRHSSLP
ncbi:MULTISPECIES: response regulator [unclassified Coleofasciculus]|uniref:response regulator n=1 Tax=unclassified Coleofasciculus TaxID=2692782 RepID=UPI002AD2B9CE|nr:MULTISPECIES: response regulator [unclassified Coleofasciculus]